MRVINSLKPLKFVYFNISTRLPGIIHNSMMSLKDVVQFLYVTQTLHTISLLHIVLYTLYISYSLTQLLSEPSNDELSAISHTLLIAGMFCDRKAFQGYVPQ